MEQNIYVWMTLRSSDGRGGVSSRIVFIGPEESCISFVQKVKWDTLKPEFKAAYNVVWRTLKPSIMHCTISAGREGTNRIEKNFVITIKKKS